MLSIEQARKHLSSDTNKELADEQVAEVLRDAYAIAHIAVDEYLYGKRLKVTDTQDHE